MSEMQERIDDQGRRLDHEHDTVTEQNRQLEQQQSTIAELREAHAREMQTLEARLLVATLGAAKGPPVVGIAAGSAVGQTDE